MAERQLEAFGPISSRLADDLLVPGRELIPGIKVEIVRRWLDHYIPFVTIGDPRDKRKQIEYKVRMIIKTPSAPYAVLEVPPSLWDPNEEEAPQYLVKIVDKKSVAVISRPEVVNLIPELKTLWLKRRDLPGREQRELLAADAREVLGELPAPGSAEDKAQTYWEFGLTNELTLAFTAVVAGGDVKVVSRWEEAGYLYVTLSDKAGQHKADFNLRWFFPFKKGHCAILLYPPGLTAEDDVPPRIAVRVIDGNTMVTLTEAGLQAVAVDCFKQMAQGTRCDPEPVKALMGAFPSWEELKKSQ